MNQTHEIIAQIHRQELLDSVHVHHLEMTQVLELWKTFRQRLSRTHKPATTVTPEACIC
jgi:hypothetical protein